VGGGILKNKRHMTRSPILRISAHMSFTYNKTHGEGHHEPKHTRSQGVRRAGFFHVLNQMVGGEEILHISMKSVIGVRFVSLLRVDKRWSGNFGSVNGGTS
jgi:hypothetical protein